MALKPNSIDCLIFSKDRAAQLDLLLRSIREYAYRLYRTVTVLYTTSAPCFDDGYLLLRDTHSFPCSTVNFRLQDYFEYDVEEWVKRHGAYQSFLCDDDVFYDETQLPATVPWSFRGGDYDYPFSVDGNVYVRHRILALLEGLSFRNPTEIEALAHDKATASGWLERDEVPHSNEPTLVGVPLNRVSSSSQMPHMGVHEYDLNERFLAGDRLVIPEPGDYGAHENLTLEWESSRAAA